MVSQSLRRQYDMINEIHGGLDGIIGQIKLY